MCSRIPDRPMATNLPCARNTLTPAGEQKLNLPLVPTSSAMLDEHNSLVPFYKALGDPVGRFSATINDQKELETNEFGTSTTKI